MSINVSACLKDLPEILNYLLMRLSARKDYLGTLLFSKYFLLIIPTCVLAFSYQSSYILITCISTTMNSIRGKNAQVGFYRSLQCSKFYGRSKQIMRALYYDKKIITSFFHNEKNKKKHSLHLFRS